MAVRADVARNRFASIPLCGTPAISKEKRLRRFPERLSYRFAVHQQYRRKSAYGVFLNDFHTALRYTSNIEGKAPTAFSWVRSGDFLVWLSALRMERMQRDCGGNRVIAKLCSPSFCSWVLLSSWNLLQLAFEGLLSQGITQFLRVMSFATRAYTKG